MHVQLTPPDNYRWQIIVFSVHVCLTLLMQLHYFSSTPSQTSRLKRKKPKGGNFKKKGFYWLLEGIITVCSEIWGRHFSDNLPPCLLKTYHGKLIPLQFFTFLFRITLVSRTFHWYLIHFNFLFYSERHDYMIIMIFVHGFCSLSVVCMITVHVCSEIWGRHFSDNLPPCLLKTYHGKLIPLQFFTFPFRITLVSRTFHWYLIHFNFLFYSDYSLQSF